MDEMEIKEALDLENESEYEYEYEAIQEQQADELTELLERRT